MKVDMKLRDNFTVAGCDSSTKTLLAPAKPTLTVDVERYQAFLDGTDMTEAQKAEFLQALWSIIVSFVELGFGVHPLQEVCGKDAEIGADSTKSGGDGVSFTNISTNDDNSEP